MNTRNIENNISKKVESWIASITDSTLAYQLSNKVIVTGGCIASMLLGEKVNDYDVYLEDADTALAVAEYYAKKFTELSGRDVSVKFEDGRVSFFVRSDGVAAVETGTDSDPDDDDSLSESSSFMKQQAEEQEIEPEYLPVFLSSNAVTLTDKVQIVIRFYGSPAEIHRNFDFVHCTGVWDSRTKKLRTNERMLKALLAKQLIFCGSLYPVAALIRVRKFLKREWTISAGQLLKMCLAINELDLMDPKVLQDQLVGMDAAYFRMLLNALLDAQGNPKYSLDSQYVCQVIDRIEEGTYEQDHDD
jgi:hypothetical protein